VCRPGHGRRHGGRTPPLPRGNGLAGAGHHDLRDLTRYPKVLIQERSREANRLHKVLQDAGMKLASVATNILGVSERAMLAAVARGETDATVLARLAKGRLRPKQAQLVAALTGPSTPPQRTLLGQQLAHQELLDRAIADLDALIRTLMAPYQPATDRLRAVTGIEQRSAEVLVAERGVDMAQLPSDRHCAASSAGWERSACGPPWNRSSRRRRGRPVEYIRSSRAAFLLPRSTSEAPSPYAPTPRLDGSPGLPAGHSPCASAPWTP
jgi:transposase